VRLAHQMNPLTAATTDATTTSVTFMA
jgi:hypothetical protein